MYGQFHPKSCIIHSLGISKSDLCRWGIALGGGRGKQETGKEGTRKWGNKEVGKARRRKMEESPLLDHSVLFVEATRGSLGQTSGEGEVREEAEHVHRGGRSWVSNAGELGERDSREWREGRGKRRGRVSWHVATPQNTGWGEWSNVTWSYPGVSVSLCASVPETLTLICISHTPSVNQ